MESTTPAAPTPTHGCRRQAKTEERSSPLGRELLSFIWAIGVKVEKAAKQPIAG